jgi:hypothetical protein
MQFDIASWSPVFCVISGWTAKQLPAISQTLASRSDTHTLPRLVFCSHTGSAAPSGLHHHTVSYCSKCSVLWDASNLGVLLHCHHHIDCIYFYGSKMLGFVRYITSSFSIPHSLCVLHATLVRPKLEYTFVAWNSFASADLSKLERVKRKCSALCHNRVYVGICCSKYEGMLARFQAETSWCPFPH